MTDQEIIQGNKLIAEFMGARFKKYVEGYAATFYYLNGKRWVQPESLKYHTSWDWLMPVVEKIISLGFAYRAENRKDGLCWFWIWEDEDDNPIVAEYSKSQLQTMYNAVISFVKWQNSDTGP